MVSAEGLDSMSQRNSARALRTITAPLEAYTTFEPRRAPSLPLPVRFGSLFGNDPGGIVSVTTIRQYQRMITAYVQQVATRSGQLRNTSQCLFCMSLASKGLQNVFCDGIPCSNCRMALKLCLKIATTIATPVEPNLAPCVARTIEGAATSCSSQHPDEDFRKMVVAVRDGFNNWLKNIDMTLDQVKELGEAIKNLHVYTLQRTTFGFVFPPTSLASLHFKMLLLDLVTVRI